MEFDHLLQLIDAVSHSELDYFSYEEEGSKVNLGKKPRKVIVSAGAGDGRARQFWPQGPADGDWRQLWPQGSADAGEQQFWPQTLVDSGTRQLSPEELAYDRSRQLRPEQLANDGKRLAQAGERENVQRIKSPLVGVFYEAPSEEAAPFVAVGDTVKKGQTLAIVEAMKLMNEIESDCDGVVKEIAVKNGQTVEYGQTLFVIAAAPGRGNGGSADESSEY